MGVVRFIVGGLPPFIGNHAADLAGEVAYRVAPRSRRAAISNLSHVMRGAPRAKLKRAVRHVFHHVMRNYYDLCRAPNLSHEQLDNSVVFDNEGWAKLLEYTRAKRGVVLVSAHFGTFDMIGQVIARRGADVRILIAQVKPAWLSDWISDLRLHGGVQAYRVDAEEGSGLNLAALKQSITFLRGGGVLGVMADRNLEAEGMVIPFFGSPALVATGGAKIALRTRSAVVICSCKRLPGNRYGVTFDEPIEPTGSATNKEDIQALLRQIFSQLERHISETPEQWVLLQSVWERKKDKVD